VDVFESSKNINEENKSMDKLSLKEEEPSTNLKIIGKKRM